MKQRRQILVFVDETAVPYGDDYEYAVQVMTAHTRWNNHGLNIEAWETFAEMPDGSDFVKTHSSADNAKRTHKKCVEEVVRQMDQMNLPRLSRSSNSPG
jgi:hypothetical protein